MYDFECITLGQLIAHLERFQVTDVWESGFDRPHSYRGYYDQLAFEAKRGVTVGAMLEAARSAVGEVFEGYKGGSYTMHLHTPVWLASYGNCGVPIRLAPADAFILPAPPAEVPRG